jgi:hypothetical protein
MGQVLKETFGLPWLERHVAQPLPRPIKKSAVVILESVPPSCPVGNHRSLIITQLAHHVRRSTDKSVACTHRGFEHGEGEMRCLALISPIAVSEAMTLALALIPSCAWIRLTTSISTSTSWHLTITLIGHRLSSEWRRLSIPSSTTARAGSCIKSAMRFDGESENGLTLGRHGTTRTSCTTILRKAVRRWLRAVWTWRGCRGLRGIPFELTGRGTILAPLKCNKYGCTAV